METWVVLFRAINVGGHHVLPMKALAAGLERERLSRRPHLHSARQFESLQPLRTGKEAFELAGGILYLYTPHGFRRSKFAAGFERLLGVAATTRNWRTVSALLQMIRS